MNFVKRFAMVHNNKFFALISSLFLCTSLFASQSSPLVDNPDEALTPQSDHPLWIESAQRSGLSSPNSLLPQSYMQKISAHKNLKNKNLESSPKETLAKLKARYARGSVRAPRDVQAVCNSVQIPVREVIQNEMDLGRSIRSLSFGVGAAYTLGTQSKLSSRVNFISSSLDANVLQDQAETATTYGASPRRVELSQKVASEHLTLSGSNGYIFRLPTGSTRTSLLNALNSARGSQDYVKDVEFRKDELGFVVINWPSEKPTATDYSDFTTNNVPSALSSRLTSLRSARALVSIVAMAPKKSNGLVPWIVVTGKNTYYSADVDSDILLELDFLQDLDVEFKNIEFDRQGGMLLHYAFNSFPINEGIIQFQVGEAGVAPPLVKPTLNFRKVAAGAELSFASRSDHSYVIETSTNLTGSWTSVETLIGTGSLVTRSYPVSATRKFWRVKATVVPPSQPNCDRIVNTLSEDLSYTEFAATLECRYNGTNYQPYNTWTEKFVGKAGYGFTARSNCEDAVEDATQFAVCNWNGINYSLYNPETNGAVGKFEYGFSSLTNCRLATKASGGSVACNWNGTNYSPYQAVNNSPLGKVDYGFTALSNCILASEGSYNGLVCNWTGLGYAPYLNDRPENIGVVDNGYSELNSCLSAVDRASDTFACNWNGSAYQPYSTEQNKPAYRSSFGFSLLESCLSTTQASRPRGKVCNPIGGGSYGLFDHGAPFESLATYGSFNSCQSNQ